MLTTLGVADEFYEGQGYDAGGQNRDRGVLQFPPPPPPPPPKIKPIIIMIDLLLEQ